MNTINFLLFKRLCVPPINSSALKYLNIFEESGTLADQRTSAEHVGSEITCQGFKEDDHIEMDPASLKRIQTFMELIQRAKQEGSKPSFVSTPTEHGDNITVVATIEGERKNAGILFWDVSLLQDKGLVDMLDEEEIALGLNLTDGMVDDAEKILKFVGTELGKLGSPQGVPEASD